MATPFFTQCACVLFEEPPALDQLEQALDGWKVTAEQEPAPGDDGWLACGRGFVLALRTGAGVVVDVVDRPWPDDPGASKDTPIAAAWRAGMFGPTAAPGALGRAKQQAWAWEDAATVAAQHRAFVRIRTVIELPAEGPAELPKGHDPAHELTTVTEVARDVLRMKGAVGFFLPAGETLRSRAQVEEALQRKSGVAPPPIDLWFNMRAMGLGQEGDARWVLVDMVGLGQLRLPDLEALFAEGQEDADAVASLLRNACLHSLSAGPIGEGSTAEDGRGRRWKSSRATGILAPRNRTVVRWLPEQSAKPGEALFAKFAPR
jgi:hypothetical protein